jgi:hypothetical protein
MADFLPRRLQNYRPEVALIPARKRHTPFTPDDPGLLPPLLQANVIFAGHSEFKRTIRHDDGYQTILQEIKPCFA